MIGVQMQCSGCGQYYVEGDAIPLTPLCPDCEMIRDHKCPCCGLDFDPADFEVLECPECGVHGSTACCIPAGRGCVCIACEENG